MKILLIGDSCIDEYHYGTIERLSPEAPVPVFKLVDKVSKPGMAANVRENFRALGVSTLFVSSDKSTKIRLIDTKSKQHVVRIDNDIIIPNPLEFNSIDPSMLNVDAIVVSDYNKGLIDSKIIEDLRANYKGPIFVDTKKKDLAKFNGCYVKINEVEYNNRISTNDLLIVTLGDRGAMFNGKVFETTNVEVVDVTGCGDTFLSALVFKFIETQDIEKAILFANKASSVTVQHMGVYAPRTDEII